MSNQKRHAKAKVKRALERRAREFAPVYSDQDLVDRVALAPVEAVRRLAAENRRAALRLAAAVSDARGRGGRGRRLGAASWEEIGRATGLNAEAARYRWGRVK